MMVFSIANSFVRKKVYLLTYLLLFPNKTILCNNKDPLWFNNEIRNMPRKTRYSNSI